MEVTLPCQVTDPGYVVRTELQWFILNLDITLKAFRWRGRI